MKNFVYVFSEADRDTLLGLGYELLQADGKGVYVFLNKEDQRFAGMNMEFALSDTLTF